MDRGAPRRWYAHTAAGGTLLFGIRRAVTRFGVATVEMHSTLCPVSLHAEEGCTEAVKILLSLEVTDPPKQPVDVYARVRSAHGNATIRQASVNGQHGGVVAVTVIRLAK